MIVDLHKEKVKDIARAQMLSWKEAFKGILSIELLSNLDVKEFEEKWKRVLIQKERKNFIWLNDKEEGIGFISFGKPKAEGEMADFEVYGIYVHPKYWGQGIGYKLMDHIVKELTPPAKIILWTMKKNRLSCSFYKRFGFNENGKTRISQRKSESFEEIQFELLL